MISGSPILPLTFSENGAVVGVAHILGSGFCGSMIFLQDPPSVYGNKTGNLMD